MSKLESILEEIPTELRNLPKILSHDSRLGIVISLLKNGDLSFSEIQKVTGIKQNVLSHHLKLLIRAAWIENYFKKNENVSNYSFYRTTSLCQDAMDKIFSIMEPSESVLTVLSKHFSKDINYDEAFKQINNYWIFPSSHVFNIDDDFKNSMKIMEGVIKEKIDNKEVILWK